MKGRGRLADKTAIVSGGASGIGEACCRLFVEEGARVVVSDINETKGEMLSAELRNAGAEAIYVSLDVSQEKDWRAAVESTDRFGGGVTILVNSAGVSGPEGRKPVETTSLHDWERVMAVNSTGVFLGMKAVIPAMRRAGGGSIINISSIYGIAGSTRGAAYHASKGAIRTLTKAAAIQNAPDNIRVNSVHPGFVDTPMTADLHSDPQERSERLSMTPLGRMGTPVDIAYGLLYLASDEAAWVTGTEFVIDGGMLAR